MTVRSRELSFLLLAICLVSGCGTGGPERAIVFGEVAYDGKPVVDGEIYFDPKQGTSGSGGAARIRYGKYRVVSREGVPLGDYWVRIRGYEVAPGKEPPGKLISWDTHRGASYVPVKYNTQTTLEFVLSEGGEVEKDFDLEQ